MSNVIDSLSAVELASLEALAERDLRDILPREIQSRLVELEFVRMISGSPQITRLGRLHLENERVLSRM